uniref:EIF3h C-terminal domain-containing protein n=1 Tax=Romanomermis culicivorax TaxID=13658 RepID=A0A915I108_ROMCU
MQLYGIVGIFLLIIFEQKELFTHSQLCSSQPHGCLAKKIPKKSRCLKGTTASPASNELTVIYEAKLLMKEVLKILETCRKHQAHTLKAFRQVNIDYQLVGWYQCVPFGASFNETMVESMFDYQNDVEESVVFIYDPVKTSQGLLSIKAYRLSAEAMKICYNDFFPESVKKSKITYENLFEEVPITIKNSSLANICLTEMALLRKPGPAKQSLDLGSSGSLEKCLRETMSHVDTLKEEVNKFIKYTASKQRCEAMRESLLQKRRLENEHRRANREPLLPAEDESMKLPRMPAPPSMLDGFLHAADINAHVDHTLQVAAQNLSKLFMAESLLGSIGGQTSSKERTVSTAASTS